jgi:hypothetical protein
LFAAALTSAGERAVRPPGVAGQFYPGDSATLAHAVDSYDADALAPASHRPIALIAPHAGYIYSGQITADAFRQAAAFDYELIVLLGTNHTAPAFHGVSVYARGAFRTPLGEVRVDESAAAALLAADPAFTFNEDVHVREHSVEVMVPFVQRLFPHATILPAIIGTTDRDLCTRCGEAVASILRNRRALIVASSDLSHYPDYDDALRVDGETLRAIASLDPRAIQTAMQIKPDDAAHNLVTHACGEGPILAAVVAARRLGGRSARIISYANSGETALGDRTRVVGYGAVAITGDSLQDTGDPFARVTRGRDGKITPSADGKRALLAFARRTIRQYLEAETAPLARGFADDLEQPAGAFVTLKIHDELRGCIGHMADDLPLCQAVGYCALQAAFNDPRFPPLRLEELPLVTIEISLLTPYQLVAGYADIQVGRDGVRLEKDGHTAVFLPQVAGEQGWDRDQLLDHLCEKAGLPSGSWKTGAAFYTFQATVFSETDRR